MRDAPHEIIDGGRRQLDDFGDGYLSWFERASLALPSNQWCAFDNTTFAQVRSLATLLDVTPDYRVFAVVSPFRSLCRMQMRRISKGNSPMALDIDLNAVLRDHAFEGTLTAIGMEDNNVLWSLAPQENSDHPDIRDLTSEGTVTSISWKNSELALTLSGSFEIELENYPTNDEGLRNNLAMISGRLRSHLSVVSR